MRDRSETRGLVAWSLIWWFGTTGVVWLGPQIFHKAFGWFAVRPTVWEAFLLVCWIVLVYWFIIRPFVILVRDDR